MLILWIVCALALLIGFAGFAWAVISPDIYDEVDDRESLFDNWGL